MKTINTKWKAAIGIILSTLVQEIKLEIDLLELLQRQKKFLLHQMFI